MNWEAIYAYVKATCPEQYDLVINGGKLVDNWSRAARHCFVQVPVMETICGLLGFDQKTARCLIETAACHDWNKRLEKKPDDFTEKEREIARQLFERAGVDKNLLFTTGPLFLVRVKDHFDQIKLEELVQFYVDDTTLFHPMLQRDRINEAESRNPRPDCPEMTADELEMRLGQKYWDAERELGPKVEEMFFDIFKARGVTISTPQQLVDHLNNELERRFS